jgi:hypothetical protein
VPLSGFSVGFVKSLAASGTVVYAGGYSAPYFSAIDVITGNVPFNIELNGGVQAVAANEKTIYIGAALGNNLIALDAFNHNPLPWNRNPNWWAVDALTLNGSTLYVASNLDTIGGQLRVELAALDADTRQVLPWRPSVNYHVYAIAANSTTVFVGGQSTNGVESRIYTTALDATSGNDLQWNPHITNGHINAIAATKTKVFLGGLFRTTGSGIIHDHFAQFDDNNPVSLNQPMSVPFSYKSSLKITNLSNKCFRKEAVAKIGYTLPISATVSMRLYNLQGHFESELVNKRQNAGEYSIVMQRGKLAAGTYLVEFKARDFREGKILTLTK